MERKQNAAPSPDGDPLQFVMSDNSVDRVGDVVEQNWQLANFKRNPIALFNHDRDQIIGKWRDVHVEGNQLRGKLELAQEDTSPTVNAVRKLIAQGILRAVSVGFQPLKKEKLDEKASEFFGPFRFLKSELLEASVVSVPANPNALAVAKSMDLPRDLLDRIFSKPAVGATENRKPAKPLDPKSSQSMQSNLSAKIHDAQTTLVALRDRLAELANKDEQTEEESARADALPEEIEQAQGALEKLLRQERALAMTAKDEIRVPPSQEIIEPPRREIAERRPFALIKGKQVEATDYMFRALSLWSAAHTLREPLEKILSERYGNDDRLHAVLRAAVNPALTTVAGWAAELVTTANVDFLPRLLPNSIYGPLSNRGARYTFGTNGQLKIPVRTTSSTLAGAWVGEGAPKPVKRASLSSVPLLPYKLAVISTFSEEMALYSTPAIEQIIRQGMQEDTSISLDTFLIDNVASSTTRPAGLLNGVSPLTATASGTALEKMVADLKQLVAAIVAAGGGRDVVILLNPSQGLALGLAQTTTGSFAFNDISQASQKFSVNFIVSTTVPAGRVIAIDAADFATATGDTPRFAVSNEATLHEEDTTPLAIGTTGSPNVVAAPTRSLFQTDSIAIRMTLYVTWVMRRTGMVQTIASVGW